MAIGGGLEGLGPDGVDEVADLELGRSEQVPVGLGGQEFGQASDVGREGGGEVLAETVGVGLLIGGEVKLRHRLAPAGGNFGHTLILASESRKSHQLP